MLIARAARTPLPEFLAERVFAPLGMKDTAFQVPADKLERFVTQYRKDGDKLVVVDAPDGQHSRPPASDDGAAGLVSTVDDWLAFAAMMVRGGAPILSLPVGGDDDA